MPGIKAEFTVKCSSTKFGENVGIIGSDGALGGWKTDGVVKLNTNESVYPSWSCQVEIQGEGEVEYKYVIVKGNRIKKWELEGRKNNRTILIERTNAGGFVARDDGEFNKLPSDLEDEAAAVSEERTNGNVSGGAGRQQSARYSPGEGTFLSHLQKESSTSRSWRKRLSYIRALLSDPNCAAENSFDPKSLKDLAIVVVYLTFVSSGEQSLRFRMLLHPTERNTTIACDGNDGDVAMANLKLRCRSNNRSNSMRRGWISLQTKSSRERSTKDRRSAF
mmetsp:Transcript_19714/g.78353  ORF Transcript_19714/g.78353 Transcript_19714/m.78353 type:complete len:277 (+) Transcript_19714:203-1033(+)